MEKLRVTWIAQWDDPDHYWDSDVLRPIEEVRQGICLE